MAADITAEILRNALVVAAEEASIVVVRSAHSTFIVESSDASAAILDRHGRLVAQSVATTLAHGASLRASLPALLVDHPAATMAPGDTFVMNDVYRGGIHSNDLLVFQPVFDDAGPAYFTGTLIHVSDLGGLSAGGVAALATDVFQEGLQLPPVRLTTEAGIVTDVERILALNSRTPDAVLGDVRALIAGTTVARRRVEALLAEYGAAGLARGVADYLDYAERRTRRSVAALPDGTWAGSYALDGDGIDPDSAPIVRVAVTVSGEEVTVDFAGTTDQVAAAINSGLSQTLSGALFGLRCFLDPAIPMNDGCLRPVSFVVPAGSLLHPRPPAPAGGRFIAVFGVIDAIVEALSAARPEVGIAASGILTPFSISPAEAVDEPWIHMAFDLGGVGARAGSDGPDATGLHFGIGRNAVPQIEPVELRCPFVVESVELRPDSGGAGRWRGGLGTRTVFRLDVDAVVTTRGDRHRIPPPGRDGGLPGAPGSYRRVAADGSVTRVPDKSTNVVLRAGERFVVETSGGGGMGAPTRRERAALRSDIAAGRVSRAAAARDYAARDYAARDYAAWDYAARDRGTLPQ